ncbi:MAG: Ribosomal RNA small subunit methyltransferase E [Acidobacteria bacterium ADurb.Bin340]|nr:MAG: Ribosomal RNA small subunit methyltransferase E [Acidobacteria bacterium ADurb.Bin340]
MSLPRFVVPWTESPAENALVPLGPEQARHLGVLRLGPGAALELLLPSGPWRADLAETGKGRATARLVAPLGEDREPPIPLHACLPLTAQLSLWDDWLPGVVELGATLIQPVLYARSEPDIRRIEARMERWERIVVGACEQSHRTRIPELRSPVPFRALLEWPIPQRWVAYELATGQANPALKPEPLAFTHGPEGGITEGEFEALAAAGWQPVTLGRSILRAATCPSALLGAVQYALGSLPSP